MSANECASFFSIEPIGEILVVAPIRDLGDLDLLAINSSCQQIIDRFVASACRHVVLDLGNITYFGSTAIGLFLRLWSKVRGADGMMVICGASPGERQVLNNTRLDTLWPVVGTRAQALTHIRTAAT